MLSGGFEECTMTRGINRRDAIRVTLGLAAIDAARGYAEGWDTPEEPEDSVSSVPGGSHLARFREWLCRVPLPAFLSRRLARSAGVQSVPDSQ